MVPCFQTAKVRLTLMSCAKASSGTKLKPLSLSLREPIKIIAKCSLAALWKSKSKAWVKQAVFQDRLFHRFIPEIEKYCLQKGISFHILLLIGSHSPIHE